MVSILKKATLLLLAVFALVSCQEKGSPNFEYIPFKREASDNWGLIGIDGKILFENKYSSCPSLAYNGIFMLEVEDGCCVDERGIWDFPPAALICHGMYSR